MMVLNLLLFIYRYLNKKMLHLKFSSLVSNSIQLALVSITCCVVIINNWKKKKKKRKGSCIPNITRGGEERKSYSTYLSLFYRVIFYFFFFFFIYLFQCSFWMDEEHRARLTGVWFLNKKNRLDHYGGLTTILINCLQDS